MSASPPLDPSVLDPAGAGALLGHGIPPSLVRRLLMSGRFGVRVAQAVDRRLGDLPAGLGASQRAVLAMDRWGLAALALRAGAIWHGRLIAKLTNGADVRALVAAIGPDLRAVALRYRELGPELPDTPLGGVPDVMEQQGVACLKAWCAAQAGPVALRMELRVPRRPVPDQTHAEHGVAIVDAVAGGGPP